MATPTAPVPSIYALRHTLVDTFDALILELETLATMYESDPYPMWSLDGPEDAAWLRRVLLDVWYEDGQPGNQTRAHIGLVGASPDHLIRIARVNRAKEAFANAVQSLRAAPVNASAAIQETIREYAMSRRGILGYSALARLHLKQTYRQLPVPEERVWRVNFAWYRSGRSIQRISVRDAEKLLMDFYNQDAPHIRIQHELLAGIPDGEPLARVRAQTPIMRLNMDLERPNAQLRTYMSRSVAMPLFVPLEPGEPLPEFNIPPREPPKTPRGKVRSDSKIEPEVFLRSLHVHRYKEHSKNN